MKGCLPHIKTLAFPSVMPVIVMTGRSYPGYGLSRAAVLDMLNSRARVLISNIAGTGEK
jgi:hypothetical protein